MSRRVSAAVCLGVAALTSSGMHGETAADISASIIYARGGTARLRNLQTERMAGTVMIGDEQGSFVREVKRPNKLRMEINIDGKTLIETYDGVAGWKADAIAGDGKVQELPAGSKKLLAEDADLDGPFLDFPAGGTTIDVLGKEMLGSSLVWKLKVTKKSGETSLYYVESTGYYILVRESLPTGKDPVSSTIYKDFRQVEGILFPSTIISSASGGDNAMTLHFDTVQVNGPIDDADFQRPTSIPSAAPSK